MPSPVNAKKGTNLFMRQGHTVGVYGNDPAVEAKGGISSPPAELKP